MTQEAPERNGILGRVRAGIKEFFYGRPQTPEQISLEEDARYLAGLLATLQKQGEVSDRQVMAKLDELVERGLPEKPLRQTFLYFTGREMTLPFYVPERQREALKRWWPELLPDRSTADSG